jgi:hypothetical protein
MPAANVSLSVMTTDDTVMPIEATIVDANITLKM